MLIGAAGALAAQAPRPLEKIQLIRLLTNPLFAQSEVADVVRRSCIGFRPTDRDWADLRSAGAGGDVIASVAACGSRPHVGDPITVANTAPLTLTAIALTPDVVAAVGSRSNIRVLVHRAGTPQRGVPLRLGGTTALALSRDVTAITDDSGVAVFQLSPIAHLGMHRLEILSGSSSALRGRPTISFRILAGAPARVHVTPEYIASSERAVTVVATVSDSLGNPVPEEAIQLTSGIGAPVFAPTDSLGRGSFVVPSASLPRGDALQLRVRALPPVLVPVADAAGLSGVATGFNSTEERHGRVGAPLSHPLLFRARNIQGEPATGRLAYFRSINARVTPDSAVLDSTGQVALQVTLGARAGEALVLARIDSVERIATLSAAPGPLFSLVIEYNGEAVTGRRISVPVRVPFILRVTARDFYGNETSIEALSRMMRAGQVQTIARQPHLQLVHLEPRENEVVVTLQAQQFGVYDFTVGSGITASVRVVTDPARR